MSYNLIVVDDDDTDRYLCSRVAAKAKKDIKIWEFSSGDKFHHAIQSDDSQIVELFNESIPPIVLLDINMPGKSGFDVVDSLREEIKTNRITAEAMAIYICSSSCHPLDVKTAKEDDLIRGFIAKPTNAAMLDELVEQNCSR